MSIEQDKGTEAMPKDLEYKNTIEETEDTCLEQVSYAEIEITSKSCVREDETKSEYTTKKSHKQKFYENTKIYNTECGILNFLMQKVEECEADYKNGKASEQQLDVAKALVVKQEEYLEKLIVSVMREYLEAKKYDPSLKFPKPHILDLRKTIQKANN